MDMKTKTFGCKCGASKTVTYQGCTVADDRKASGYKPVFTHTGHILWFCPECTMKIEAAAKVIMEVVQDEYLHFPNLLPKTW